MLWHCTLSSLKEWLKGNRQNTSITGPLFFRNVRICAYRASDIIRDNMIIAILNRFSEKKKVRAGTMQKLKIRFGVA